MCRVLNEFKVYTYRIKSYYIKTRSLFNTFLVMFTTLSIDCFSNCKYLRNFDSGSDYLTTYSAYCWALSADGLTPSNRVTLIWCLPAVHQNDNLQHLTTHSHSDSLRIISWFIITRFLLQPTQAESEKSPNMMSIFNLRCFHSARTVSNTTMTTIQLHSQDACAPISKLLDELLLSIFVALIPSWSSVGYYFGPTTELARAISQVCSRWQQISLETSSLWRSIKLWYGTLEWKKEVFRRSANAPFIEILSPNEKSFDDFLDIPHVLPRIRFFCGSLSDKAWIQLFNSTQQPGAQLEHLLLENSPRALDGSTKFQGDVSPLQYLRVQTTDNMDLTSLFFSNLREVNIGQNKFPLSVSYLKSVAANIPFLERLTIRGTIVSAKMICICVKLASPVFSNYQPACVTNTSLTILIYPKNAYCVYIVTGQVVPTPSQISSLDSYMIIHKCQTPSLISRSPGAASQLGMEPAFSGVMNPAMS